MSHELRGFEKRWGSLCPAQCLLRWVRAKLYRTAVTAALPLALGEAYRGAGRESPTPPRPAPPNLPHPLRPPPAHVAGPSRGREETRLCVRRSVENTIVTSCFGMIQTGSGWAPRAAACPAWGASRGVTQWLGTEVSVDSLSACCRRGPARPMNRLIRSKPNRVQRVQRVSCRQSAHTAREAD